MWRAGPSQFGAGATPGTSGGQEEVDGMAEPRLTGARAALIASRVRSDILRLICESPAQRGHPRAAVSFVL
jgi:hypothetical protein